MSFRKFGWFYFLWTLIWTVFFAVIAWVLTLAGVSLKKQG